MVPESPRLERAGASDWGALAALAVLALASVALLARGTLDAPLVSEDSSALGYVAREAPWVDFARTQYDLRTVRFWRPLITLGLDLQESLSGADPGALRIANLGFHALGAVLCGALALALGAGRWAAALAVLWAVAFPFAGGTAHWVVGRVDSQSLPMVLACAWFALTGRRGPAALFAFLALATKESGAVAAPLAATLCLARGDRPGQALAATAPAFLALALGLAVRRAAIGMWVGGYAVEGQGSSGGPASGGGWAPLLQGLESVAIETGPWLVALPLAMVLGALSGIGRPRAALLTAVGGLGALAPVLPLLARGALEPVHLRWMLAPDALLGVALALAVGAAPRALGRGRSAVRAILTLGLLLGVILPRFETAREDMLRWAAAGRQAERVESAARAALVSQAPSQAPVLVASAERTDEAGRAYVLLWGLTDRFRPPFEPSPRPVWPWRPLFGAVERDRDPATIPRGGLRLPFGEGAPTVPTIPITVFDRLGRVEPGAPVELDGRVLTDLPLAEAPLLVVEGEYPTPRMEWLLFTELGFGTGLAAALPATAALPPQFDLGRPAAGGARLIPLRDALLAVNDRGFPIHAVLRQAADFGASEAYLQLRAVDDERGRRDRPVAASRWIRLTWDEDFRRTMLPR